jgi:hypothetical protein
VKRKKMCNIVGYIRLKKTLRQLSKGMGANLDGQIKRSKIRLLEKSKELDDKAGNQGLSEEEWTWGYTLEG